MTDELQFTKSVDFNKTHRLVRIPTFGRNPISITNIIEYFPIDTSKNMGTLFPPLKLICLESLTG